ncbi:YggS family pyridoxal phosphate-dependent enzyme [Aquimarina sp. TRL1]|uniref:YggS family pyridoxal phosphate-dependent enzyme n=1 Tax=Aquimarina sp. (strain TRL1) TaxID=2736252 RepID=UPI001588972D|nr:YggS family pyridoxal phosphate-dependent enzyme [Aquimarina sp. TRL1]QKX07444.1 YggS family pyridoxal phosphate-dependent enzyme [Aquimarina sp. TRL1]
MSITSNLQDIQESLPKEITLVAVSKTKPVADIKEAYQAGHRVFGENKIQEMTEKWEQLPQDILWHMIGHVQTNKVKYMAPYVHLIHAVDSLKLLKEINKQALKNKRIIHCLLQIKIAEEESKFGLSPSDAQALLASEEVSSLSNVHIEGFMGMATFTDNQKQIRQEFSVIKNLFDEMVPQYPQLKTLSIGMSGDYEVAIASGSTMVRIGSSIFGKRNYV